METYTTPQLESGEGLSVGDRVESKGDLLTDEDRDEGYVLAIDDRQITVGWDSGVMTTQDISLLCATAPRPNHTSP